jgi:hypothetical protein
VFSASEREKRSLGPGVAISHPDSRYQDKKALAASARYGDVTWYH